MPLMPTEHGPLMAMRCGCFSQGCRPAKGMEVQGQSPLLSIWGPALRAPCRRMAAPWLQELPRRGHLPRAATGPAPCLPICPERLSRAPASCRGSDEAWGPWGGAAPTAHSTTVQNLLFSSSVTGYHLAAFILVLCSGVQVRTRELAPLAYSSFGVQMSSKLSKRGSLHISFWPLALSRKCVAVTKTLDFCRTV